MIQMNITLALGAGGVKAFAHIGIVDKASAVIKPGKLASREALLKILKKMRWTSHLKRNLSQLFWV